MSAPLRVEPIEVRHDLTILKSWLVNDPFGRWRAWTETYGLLKVTFKVDSGEGCIEFEIPRSVRHSLLWVQQDKEQWIITEYVERVPVGGI